MIRGTSVCVLLLVLAVGVLPAQPMGGTYTIKTSGGDFDGFGSACAALSSRGYTRACTMLCYTGTYTTWGNAMNFSSDTVPVIFKAAPGNRPVQTYAGYGLNITGTDLLTFDSIWFSTGNHCLYGTGLKKLTVRNCSLVTTGSGYGWSLSTADSGLFENNVTNGRYACAFAAGCDDNMVRNNRLYARSSYGIYLSGTSYKLRNTFINNFVYGYTTYGMYSTYDSMTRCYFNSFYSSSAQPCMYVYTNSNVRAVDNIFSSGSGVCFNVATGAVLDTANYNCLYTTGSYVGSRAGTSYDWSGWRGLGYEANGINQNPQYISPPTDLHIGNGSPCVGAGITYGGVTIDIDTMSRSSPPCIGADEVITTPQDVGCTRLLSPTGNVDSGVAVTPACSVYNYGTTTPGGYAVRMRVGSYNQTVSVTGHAPGTRVYVTFPDWTPDARGSFSVSCSTECPLDTVASNNKQTGSVTVEVTDVGCSRLLVPSGTLDSGVSITPACSVFNYGTTTPATYDVRMKVGTYNQTATVTSHAPGTALYVTFPDWVPDLARGRCAVSCSTELATDLVGGNDKIADSVTVLVKDVAATAMAIPTGSYPEDTFIRPRATWRNNGSQSASFEAWVMMYDASNTQVYAVRSNMTNLIPGGSIEIGTFAPCTLKTPGTWTARCSTFLANDVVPVNDTLSRQFTVVGDTGTPPPPPPGGGWTLKNPMPAGAKPAKDGAWLDYDAGTKRIYASRGNKQPDFFAYDPVGDSWGLRPPWQPGVEGKLPQKSSAGCADGNGVVWATKGNNTLGFWKYDAAANAWTQKKDVPLGTTNKKLKGGSGITWAYKGGVGSPFLLKGYKNEFYRYDVLGDSWSTLTPAPVGAKEKWDKGSWLAYDDVNNRVYAFKAKYMEFYSYNPNNDSWSVPLAPMPVAGPAGNKKAKDGSCGTYFTGGSIYSLKGGNTQEFWKYTIASNAWATLETIPRGVAKKKVKAGGSITAAGNALYALKGNKTNELWQYGFATFMFEPPRRDGVLAGKTVIAQGMSISPNPLASGFAVLRYGLPKAGAAEVNIYNVAGQTVASQTFTTGRSGSVNLDLRHLSNGVYLVKFSSEGFANSQKLVVQR